MIKLVKFNLNCYREYIELLNEFKKYNSELIPNILEIDCNNEEDYNKLVEEINNRENGIHNDLDWYKNSYYYLAYNDKNVLVGIGCIRKNLTKLGNDIWGNIAYGVKPTERRKGYATEIAIELINKCRNMGINEIILCHYTDNEISPKIFQKVGALYTNTITSAYSGKNIKRYVINV